MTTHRDIPALFEPDFRALSEALERAQVFGRTGYHSLAAEELDAAADAAENIVLVARRKAQQARKQTNPRSI